MMLTVYRVTRSRYAFDLTGEGARLFGGRWNHKSVPCIYTSENRALAVLEYTVNINVDEVPRALNIIAIELGDVPVLEPDIETLPGNWQQTATPVSTKNFGTALLQKMEYPVIKLPSSVLPEEYNYIINPLHPAVKQFRITGVSDFVYDLRIKKA